MIRRATSTHTRRAAAAGNGSTRRHATLLQARSLLEASHQRFADLYDFAPVGYLSLSLQGEIEEINLAGAQLLGQPRSRLLGTPLSR
jgi:PAS domain-containing protein